ncbi:hypothetical protein P154DRAFT_525809 [Amniculicola lignicola CBS 123094]|uniref:HAD-like protein n=1 Tax=Amniculicola lignicola CBS 123094 TaxID=1392246 RepID=A0A6A5W2G7_9PLEO|nr:hypothetical protein P154DRAFT_525809 [Amniculicola lignicola CBS 123094]
MPRPFLRAFNTDHAIHWILDWDGTLTTQDTLDTLVNIPKETKNDPSIPKKWAHVIEAYLDDMNSTLTTLGHLPSTVPEERKLLGRLRDVEERSVTRVSDSGIFAGLREEDLCAGGVSAIVDKTIQLRKGAALFIEYIFNRTMKQETDIDAFQILSVNWSQCFIATALEASVDFKFQRPTLDHFQEQQNEKYALLKNEIPSASHEKLKLDIYANEIDSISTAGTSQGRLCSPGTHKIISSSDKLSYLRGLQKLNPNTLQLNPIVYIGDSWTDLECLLAADLGICIRDEPPTSSQRKLEDSLQRLSIPCQHILDDGPPDEWDIVWARDFTEIRNWLRSNESSAFIRKIPGV